MKIVLQVALGVVLGGGALFFGQAFLAGPPAPPPPALQAESAAPAPQARSSAPAFRTVTEVIKPRSVHECQAIHGAELNEAVRSCMEGSILTVRIDSNTGDRQILKRERYYHLERQNVL